MMDINIVKRVDVSMTIDELEVIKFALCDYVENKVTLARYRDLAELIINDINNEKVC